MKRQTMVENKLLRRQMANPSSLNLLSEGFRQTSHLNPSQDKIKILNFLNINLCIKSNILTLYIFFLN